MKYLTLIVCGAVLAFACPTAFAGLARDKLVARLDIDEYLSGLVIYRISATGEREYLLLKKAKGDQEYQPAKGHVDPGENTYQAALRETLEETGLAIRDYVVFDHPLMHQYTAGDGTTKQVDMWPARVVNPQFPIIITPEHSEFLWATIARTVELVNKRWRNEVFLPTDVYLNSI